ncbi:pilin [Dyella silvatica]|uniref:pilin n=1 Tax=Dyella silvatica TaxID=2992128 RepID=UPI002258F7C5|nr:pilin [Dyella silvatica]
MNTPLRFTPRRSISGRLASRRWMIATVLTAGLAISACHREPSNTVDAAAIQRAQAELSQPAWLRNHLPNSTVAYLRIPSPWGMLGAVPNGRPLDAAMASEQHLKAVAALREAIAKDKVLADAGVTPYLLPLLADLRSPVEVALIDPIGFMSPGSHALISLRIAQKTVAELNARFSQLEAAGLKLAAPLDDKGDGKLASGPLVHFDTASGRLFVFGGKDEVPPAQLANLLEELQKTKNDSDNAKALAAQELKIDQSGQGLFGWFALRGVGGIAASSIPTDKAGTLPGDITAKTESIAFGAGTVDGHGRMQLIVHAPQARLLSYLAPKQFKADFNTAGQPRWVMNLALPSVEQADLIEHNLSLDFGAENAASVRKASADMQQKLGFSMADLSKWFGPELVIFQDEAGTYTAVRSNDRKAFYAALPELSKRMHGSYATQSLDGMTVHALTVTTPDMPAPDDKLSSGALKTLMTRLGTHLYWVEDGDYLIFAQLPQMLADRHAAKLDTNIGTWLSAQAWQGQQNLLAFTTVSRDAQRNAYYTYLQLLQALNDLSGQQAGDLMALPAAYSFKLPSQGVLGASLGASSDDLSLSITYEQQPFEALGSGGAMTTVAVMAIGAAVAIPAYEDYTVRSQANEGLTLAEGVKVALSSYRESKGRWPKDNAQAGLDAPGEISGQYVDRVAVQPEGAIEVHFGPTLPHGANARLSDKSFTLVPKHNSADGWSWSCKSDEIADKDLPKGCKQP